MLTASSAAGAHSAAPVTSTKVGTVVVDPAGQPGAAVHYLADRDSLAKNTVYGFTSVQAQDRYLARRAPQTSTGPAGSGVQVCPDAWFNQFAYGTGNDWLRMTCGQTNYHLSDSWNDKISHVQGGGSWTVLYKCYYFSVYPGCNTLAVQGGTTFQDLAAYGFSDYTSSIKVCPEGLSLLECRGYF